MLKQSTDHIVHYVLTRYALGASPESIQKIYDETSSYQRLLHPTDENVVNAMADKGKFKGYLDDEKQYTNFLTFFQREIEKKGVGEVINEHVFAGDEHADSMLVRVFAGWFTPPVFFLPAIASKAIVADFRFLLPLVKAFSTP